MKGCFLVGFERHCYCSVSQSCPTLRPHGLQQTRFPCPSPSPGVCSDSCPLRWWCHPNHFLLRCPFLLLPSVFASMRVFSSELALCIRWPGYWSFSFSTSPSNEYSGSISFRMDWLDLLAVQGTLKSLLQHHSQKHQFFGAQPFLWSSSHTHMWLLEKP